MKSVALIAGFATSLAAAHAGHGHAHAHDRRGADDVVTSWDVTTEWTYVTVTAGHEQPAPSDNSPADAPAANSPNAPAPAPASAPASAPVAKASSSDVQAAAVTSAPAAATTGSDVNANQAKINKSQDDFNSAYAKSMSALQASIDAGQVPPAQTQATAVPTVASSSAAAQPVAASSAAAPSASSGGSTSAGGSNCKTTQLSYYGGGGALGSCGWPVYDSNNTVAMPPGLVKCGQKIKIQVHGPNPVPNDPSWHEAIVTDTCPGCTDGHVDGAQDWAQKIAPGIVTPGKADITYCWED